jgi:Pyridoxamine 5'-phosphate oxidase
MTATINTTPASSSSSSSSSSNKQSFVIAALVPAVFLAAPILYYHVVSQRIKQNNKNKNDNKNDDNNNNNNNGSLLSSASLLSTMARRGSQLRPPFPQVIRDMLSKCQLAYLSTVDSELSSSHLSLMRFTYWNDDELDGDGEIMILSTNRQTKKFDMLQQQNGVALLVHDFGGQHQGESSDGGGGGMYTITLNGTCRIVDDPIKAERYRQAHLAHNPDYPQFILGENIAILCVYVTSARICDIHDSVTKWDILGSGNDSSNNLSSLKETRRQ